MHLWRNVGRWCWNLYRAVQERLCLKISLCRVIKEVWIMGGKYFSCRKPQVQTPAVEVYPKFKDQLRGQYTRAAGSGRGWESRWSQRRMGPRPWGEGGRVLWPLGIIGFYSEWNGEPREDFELKGDLIWLEFNGTTLAENTLKSIKSGNRLVRGYCVVQERGD